MDLEVQQLLVANKIKSIKHAFCDEQVQDIKHIIKLCDEVARTQRLLP